MLRGYQGMLEDTVLFPEGGDRYVYQGMLEETAVS